MLVFSKMKDSTVINLVQTGAPPEIATRLPKGQLIRIKLEIDTDPPSGAVTETLTRLIPTPHEVRVYDLPSLFAGKLHAVLCRNWKSRVKGRDFYDLVWYVGRKTLLNLKHLEARMRQSGDWDRDFPLDVAHLADCLAERFANIQFDQAKQDVEPFLKDPREIALWSHDFFRDLIPLIQFSND